ncbi:hypothetical protein N9X53_07890, partial [Mariniblastus sp.]|nr:hypothetical protein [Mariniblastus sp.]
MMPLASDLGERDFEGGERDFKGGMVEFKEVPFKETLKWQAPPTSQLGDERGGGAASAGGREANDGKKVRTWALSGLGSLNIELTETGNSIEFYNLGDQPTLTATVINQSRLNWLAIALALLIAALGVLLTNRQFKSKVLFVTLVLLVACLVPLSGVSLDAFRTIIDLAILSGTFVA